jgi:hypothetical protein
MTDEKKEVFVKLVKNLMDESTNELRRQLDKQLFVVDPFLKALPKPTRIQIIKRKVRFYFLNWWDAIKGIGRAVVGKDTNNDYEDY